jgi:crossover junction endodeoxyribonuclease RuvC
LEVVVRVLGLDPGTVATGWGVIDQAGHRLTYVAGGVIRSRGTLPQRLARVYEEARRILSEFAPSFVSLEKTFVGQNVQSAFRLGEARGAILVASAQAGVLVCEYSPAEIKVAVAGNGRAAKEQMQIMVARLLALRGALAGDEADALGAAICHLHTHGFAARVSRTVDKQQARPSRRPRKDGASSGRTEIFFESNDTTVRPEEPPSPGGVSKGVLARKSTVPSVMDQSQEARRFRLPVS